MKHRIAYLTMAAMGLSILLAGCQSSPVTTLPAVQSVASVTLERYLGTWYEIANFPMRFQRDCVGDTTANYRALPGGDIEVTNRCRTATGFNQAIGKAKVVEGTGNAQLRVSFFWPFYGDYWVIGLAPDYRWAVVGEPSRKYLWLLSRTPKLSPTDREAALAAARSQGYDLSPLRFTSQSTATPD